MRKVLKPKKSELIFAVAGLVIIATIVGLGFYYMNRNTVQTEKDSSAATCYTCYGQFKYSWSCSKPIEKKNLKTKQITISQIGYCSSKNETGTPVFGSANNMIGKITCTAGQCLGRMVTLSNQCVTDPVGSLTKQGYTNVSCY